MVTVATLAPSSAVSLVLLAACFHRAAAAQRSEQGGVASIAGLGGDEVV